MNYLLTAYNRLEMSDNLLANLQFYSRQIKQYNGSDTKVDTN